MNENEENGLLIDVPVNDLGDGDNNDEDESWDD